jgi:hypothetical protein
MRPRYCLCDCPQQAGIVKPGDTAIARQRLGKQVPAARNTHATIKEVLDTVFSMQVVSYQILSALCNGRKVIPFGGGVEYPHRVVGGDEKGTQCPRV